MSKRRRWPVPPRRRATTAERREIYLAAKGEDEYPMCNLCPFPVMPWQPWERSHEGAPNALGGQKIGIAHKSCNWRDGVENVTPMVAKTKRQWDKHRGIKVSRNPARGGRQDPWKRKLDGTVVDRVTGEPWESKRDD